MLFAILFATNIFSSYENARQALLKTSVPDVQSSARQLAAIARAEKQPAIAAKADAVAAAKDIASARTAFAALSDEVIKFRAAVPGDRPAVAYCPMEKKSWLQPKGEITNPYVAPPMRGCGELR
ncbi:MAG TPA: hypothetical protein VG323_11960 [Thermoanaerobaculia bacterium]|nr:hypothetical protein [Thermoanaerobaculia bacterium]